MNDIRMAAKVDISVLGFCKLHKTSLEISPDINRAQYRKIGESLHLIQGSIQFWIGDWLRFGERKWGEMYKEAEEITGFSKQTLRNNKWVSDKVEMSVRTDKLPYQHHEIVAALPQREQKKWLGKAIEDNLSARDLRQEIRTANVKPAPPLPSGLYDVIYADPPWRYDFNSTDESRAIENQYPTMETHEIGSLKIPSAENAVLFLWATAPKMPEALLVLMRWGFKYRTHMVWDKEIIGMGYWFRGQHELLMIGVKGQLSPPQESVRISSVFRERRGKHSAKPLSFYRLIETYFPHGKYLELFCRTPQPNWKAWGNEIIQRSCV